MRVEVLSVLIGTLVLAAGSAAAFDGSKLVPQVEQLLRAEAAAVQGEAQMLDALRTGNAVSAGLTDADIAARDTEWRAQTKTGRGALIDPILRNPASDLLRRRQAASLGLLAEIFVFDAKGLNVAQTNVTSDYLQADEPKYQMTFTKGPGALHIEEAKFDESANTYVMTGSMTLVDPQTGTPIGAITIAVDLGKL